ncbi:MAG TPA: ABC transporter permease [Jatrophihabitans sp.]|uniref:ABC transporter permease n=1 Tax=Jatrophihabitans sp. TaxID=1932789 RepID=UPI002DFB395D|nr:ABC transporter permease [Jatrophihabitans sp.]
MTTPAPLAVTAAALRRLVRDRTAMFFVVVLPVVVILIIGLTARGFDKLRVGVVVPDGSGPLATQLAEELGHDPTLTTTTYTDAAAARTGLRRGELVALVVLPRGYDTALAAGRPQQIGLLTSVQSSDQQAVGAAISAVVGRQAARVQAAHFASVQNGSGFGASLARATALQPGTTVVGVHTTLVDTGASTLPAGFSYSAPTMLVLFVFINALAGGAAIIQARQLGIHDRAMAAPITARTIVLGETLAALVLALLQSLLIVGIGAVVFGVHWGDPVAAATLVVVWALVGTGAGVLSGTVFRTPEQAGAIGPAIGIAFGMLGGCMWPLEIVTPLMRTVGHVVPHAWAVDAWTTLLSRGGDLASIARPLLVLAGMAVALLALSTLRLRARIVR